MVWQTSEIPILKYHLIAQFRIEYDKIMMTCTNRNIETVRGDRYTDRQMPNLRKTPGTVILRLTTALNILLMTSYS